MRNVKIHAIPSDYLSPPVQGSSFCTDMISYDDYKKLEGMFIDVASENALLKKFIRESCYVFDGEQSDISDAYTPADQSPLMPGLEATKKFSTEMMAQGVHMYGMLTIRIGEQEQEESIIYAGKQALLYAEQLRNGDFEQ